MNELAKRVLEDGQDIRPFYNYLSETYDEIKNKDLFPEGGFTDRIGFYKHLRDVVLPSMISGAEAWKEDDIKEYTESNI